MRYIPIEGRMKKLKDIYAQVKNPAGLNEEITRKELAPMLDSFVSFASDKLGIKSLPSIRYKNDEDDYNSFAAYSPASNELSISTMNRHPMDIFRSIAHELVHHKQNEDGRIGQDVAKEGETGSDTENEANAEAGKIMRWFAKANPDMFTRTHVVESTNSAAMAPIDGIRGLGNVTGDVAPTVTSKYLTQNISDTTRMQSNHTQGLWSFDDDSPWMDQKGRLEYHAKTNKGKSQSLNEGVNDPGRLKAIFLAGGPGSGKDFVLKRSLSGNGLRELNADRAFEHLMRRHGLDFQMPKEEEVEREQLRSKAKKINDKSEINSLSGRLGHIINSTADNYDHIKAVKDELEDLGYDTSMVFVNTSNEVSRARNVVRGKKGERKVPDGTDNDGIPNGTPNIRGEKWLRAQENHDRFRELFGNNFTSIENSEDLNAATPERRKQLEAEFTRVRRHATSFTMSPVENERGNQWIKSRTRYTGVRKYTPPKASTRPAVKKPVEQPKSMIKPDENVMNQARAMGLSYMGADRFGRRVGGKKKPLFVKKDNTLVREPMSEDLRQWFSKTHPKGKWKRLKPNGEIAGDCAREPGEGKPKCLPAAKAYSMSKEERAEAAQDKRRKDPVADRRGKGNKPINVRTESVQKAIDKINADRMSEEILMEKNVPTNPSLWSKAKSLAKSKFDVYPSAYANGWAAKWYKSKGGNWKTQANEELQNEACWDGYEQKGMKKKGSRMVPNCVPVSEDVNENFEAYMCDPSNREIGKPSLTKIYMTMTPGQEPGTETPDANKRKKLAQEDAGLPKGAWDLASMNDGLGPTFSLRASPALVTGFANIGSTLAEASPSIREWALKEDIQMKFIRKYGDHAVNKLLEACLTLEEAGCGCKHSAPKSIKKLRESFDKGIMDVKPIGIGMYRPHMDIDEDWQDVNRKDKTDGMSQAAVNAYRRENPGSNLSTAVTEKNPSGRRKKRRLSFCRRMRGMKRRLTSAKTARDPDSDINKALRRWNCKE